MITDQTLSDESSLLAPSLPPAQAWLIYIGSSENQFFEAGAVWSLDQVSTVRFGRGSSEVISTEQQEKNLQVTIPLGWISQAHVEMRIVKNSNSIEFDLRDLGSRNGTHIEGQSIPGIARLKSGQIFEIGRSFWMVREVRLRNLPAEPVRLLDPAGTSNPTLCGIQRTLAQLAVSTIPLMLRGETGTGKEVTAREVHQLSGRRGAFVSANLAALSEERMDLILFGHRRGAVPGANQDRPGIFEQAEGGTLYLDELSELSSRAQVKLLAALAEGQVVRVGETEPRRIDVRVISSCLQDVHAMVQTGRFRPDLYSRLAGFEAMIPPLRERSEDLGVLTRALCQTRNTQAVRVETRAFRRILGYGWSFNVRELGQSLATASILAGIGGKITKEVLDEILERRSDMPKNPGTVSELRNQLVSQLARSGGDTAEVARVLDKDQKEIHRWLERFELQPDAYR